MRFLRVALLFIVFNIVAVALLVGAAEIAARLILPDATPRFISAGLFEKNMFGSTFGLRPNHTGTVGGAKIFTDGRGCRITPGGDIDSSLPTLVFLGDSVTFGNSVQSGNTFVDITTSEVGGKYNVVNLSAPGWNLEDYINVLEYSPFFRGEDMGVVKVVLVYSLNDAYDVSAAGINKSLAGEKPPKTFRTRLRNHLKSISVTEDFNAFLARKSRLYLVFKKYGINTPKVWYENMAAHYRTLSVGAIEEKLAVIKSRLDRGDIEVTALVLPYAYQLGEGGGDSLLPQEMVLEAMEGAGIPCHDLTGHLRDAVSSEGMEGGDIYTYADAMHFNAAGHRLIAREILRKGFCFPLNSPGTGVSPGRAL